MDVEGATANIAAFARNTALPDFGDTVRGRGALVIADTIAATLAGTTGDVAGPLRQYVEPFVGHGDARILGWGLPVPGEVAALANGTLGHALDFDDVVSLVPGHPSAVVVAALLAAKPAGALTGAEFLQSYIVGVEVAAKVGKAIGLGHAYQRGLHATGTMGIFGAIAGLSKLLHLDERQIRCAIGAGSSMASGLQCNFGTMTKPLHSGWAARSALVAVELARSGWTSNETALEGRGGFFEVYGTSESSASTIAPSLGNPYVFVDPGVALKQYPCCYAVHRAIDGLRTVIAGPTTVEEITEIRCSVPPGGLSPLPYTRPKTGLEGKFSMEYALAATALDGTITLKSFETSQVLRPSIAELYERITIREEERCAVGESVRTVARGTIGFVEVTVRFAGGISKTATTYKPKGSPAQPLEWPDVRDKFLSCADVAGLGESDARELVDALQSLEKIDDLELLLRRLGTTKAAAAAN